MSIETRKVGARGVTHVVHTDPGSAVSPGTQDASATPVDACEPLQFVVEWTNRHNERRISKRPSSENAQGFAEGLWAAGYVSAKVTIRGGTYNERTVRDARGGDA